MTTLSKISGKRFYLSGVMMIDDQNGRDDFDDNNLFLPQEEFQ